MNTSKLSQQLEPLHWRRVRMEFRNLKNEHARQHPMFVFNSLFKEGAKRAGLRDQIDYFYRPVGQPFPTRVLLQHRYQLQLVFPVAESASAEKLVEGVKTYLADGKKNWRWVSGDSVEERSLENLLHESNELDRSSDELCLDFLTPLVFNPEDRKRPWMFSAAQMIQFCAIHLARLFPAMTWPLDLSGAGKLQGCPYFWDPFSTKHFSKSQHQNIWVKGQIGPYYLHGEWQPLLPLLLLCSELHTGNGKGCAHAMEAQRKDRHLINGVTGGFELRSRRSCLDRQIVNPARYEAARRFLIEDSAVMDELRETLDEGVGWAEQGCQEVRGGVYHSGPVREVQIPKPSDQHRSIHLLCARDRLIHQVLGDVLGEPLDRMFEAGSVGFRPGRSVQTARSMIQQAIRDGATYAVRADVESFFDRIPWGGMKQALEFALPRADRLTRLALEACWSAPLKTASGIRPRDRGLLQGSPISPLLANLYLDSFDEKMQAQGFQAIRYGDDFLILTHTLDQAHQALDLAARLLKELELDLHPEKTSITPLDLQFTFLGMELPGKPNEEAVDRACFRKPLLVKQSRCFTGVDGQSIVVRKGKELQARVPMDRVGEVVFYGDGAVSHRLLQACAERKIPVSFCTDAGWHACTVRPDSRYWFGRVARHEQRFNELGESGRTHIARMLVEAKIRNYLAWFSRIPADQAKDCRTGLEKDLSLVAGQDSASSLRGVEGAAARRVFRFLNRCIQPEGFRAEKRLPREKPDRLNALLDSLYSRLFVRLNVLLLNRGLSPYLGFLHSAKDPYESLVCDLQEPFRARVDQLAVKLINRNEIQEGHFTETDHGWKLSSDGFRVCLQAFSREEQVRLARDLSNWGQLISAQIESVREWVDGAGEFPRIYVAKNPCRKASQNPE